MSVIHPVASAGVAEPANIPISWVHTLVVGSGAAGLNAAVQLRACGVEDLLIITEGLDKGTSINTGSDKQTYYKLSLCGREADSPQLLAETYFSGGSMHGDLALVEASLSARAFLHLVNLGVQFPRDRFGQFVGYKTDHDPRQRATSIGPYTSRQMCQALIRQAERLQIPVRQQCNVVRLLTVDEGAGRRAAGVVLLDQRSQLEAICAENVVFAVGGPGGLYRTSVYPAVHTGAIGLALLAGAAAQNLPESQYGLASVGFRWNVSGSYMQVIPRFISTAADGRSDQREFLRDYFADDGQLCSMVFLKGYQWPFDARKVLGGSSLIDILVYIETEQRGRRVFLDFRCNPTGFQWERLSAEARDYLLRCGATQQLPIERLRHMNPGAVELYAEHGIDISAEPLEIAVCAQHNNGGLAANCWWESVNIKHLFPVGEVNGSHGVYRPGGAALNAGQVGGFRAAEFIANRYAGWTLRRDAARQAAVAASDELWAWLARCPSAALSWQQHRQQFRQRMSAAGAHIRRLEALDRAVPEAWQQFRQLRQEGCRYNAAEEMAEALRTFHLCYAQAVYLDAIRFALQSGVGSRGSAIVLHQQGLPIHDRLDDTWRMQPEDESFRQKVLETHPMPDSAEHRWTPRREIPHTDLWFETTWADFRAGRIYD